VCDEVNAEVVVVAILEEQSCDDNPESVSRFLFAFRLCSITEFWLLSPVVAVSRLVDVELAFISFRAPLRRLSSNESSVESSLWLDCLGSVKRSLLVLLLLMRSVVTMAAM